jgi:hypothetical protein
MEIFKNRRVATPVAMLVALVVTATMALAAGGTATSAPRAPAAVSKAPVAHTGEGALTSRIRGTTANDRVVTGKFVPLTFSKRDGKVFVRGLVSGVVHNADGSTRTFGVMRKLRVKTINGQPATTARVAGGAAPCDVLNLVLGPLDLDLLGLQVHLDRVVLNIVAQSGAGNLLGNLLCAVTGLLDGGLDGVLGRLVNLLNRILGRLGLGL